MFSCNEKTKKSEYIYIYKYIRETDRQTRRPGLLKGEWGQGSWYTGPSPLGDSPAVILCLGEPSTSLVLLLPPPHPRPLLRSHSPSSLPSLPLLRLLLLRRGWKLRFQPETLPQAKRGGVWREDLKIQKWQKKQKKKQVPLVSTEAAVVPHPVQALPTLSMPTHLPVPPLSWKNKRKHTLVKLPWQLPVAPLRMVTDGGVRNFWAWSVFIFFFLVILLLYVDYVCVRWESLGEEW